MGKDWVDNLDWGNWRKLAIVDEFFPFDEDEEDFSGVYELGLKETFFGDPDPVYVGESGTVLSRLETHASGESHLNEIIHWHLKRGFTLYARFVETKSKKKAEELELALLDDFDYDWNLKDN